MKKIFDKYGKCPPISLYMGNLLRKGYSKDVIEIQDKFREGK